jgi:spermidine/putrescine transport system substrate-binding protein
MTQHQPFNDEFLRRGISRRGFLAGAGGLAGAAALGPLLAACSSSPEPTGGFEGEPTGIVNVASWPLYVDRGDGPDGEPTRPSLERFFLDTGIAINYREVISDAEAFYQKVRPYLARGRPTGWDVMVITNGVTLSKLIALGQIEELPSDLRPNFDANASDAVRDPAYDPGNRHSMAWQSGITGIAYNRRITGRDITSLRDLFSDEFRGRVGMFGDPVDLPNLALLAVGASPETSNPSDWRAAAGLLGRQREAGIVRDYYSQTYIKALAKGDLALSMAWSGDIFQQIALGESDLRFVVPEEGALLWTDAMVVPRGAQHPADAMAFMDFVYRPDIAAMIAAWVAYVTPVPAAREVMLEDAATLGGDEAAALQSVAESSLVFPAAEDLARLSTYRELIGDEELAEWDELFASFYV